jgi:hypothetical protein
MKKVGHGTEELVGSIGIERVSLRVLNSESGQRQVVVVLKETSEQGPGPRERMDEMAGRCQSASASTCTCNLQLKNGSKTKYKAAIIRCYAAACAPL